MSARLRALTVVMTAVVSLPWLALADRQVTRRTVYVTATARSGRPVLDLEPEDFDVRERGVAQQIGARLTTAPLRVTLVVSDRTTGAFQAGALSLCEALLGQASITIVRLANEAERLVEDAASADALRPALRQLGRRATLNVVGADLTEAIQEAAEAIRRPGTRAAIVVMRAGSEAPTNSRADRAMDALRRSGAVLYVVSLARDNAFGAGAAANPALQTILNDGARESGGRRVDIAGTSAVPAVQQIASELLNAYEITYDAPPGARSDERVSVTSRRDDVIVRAPSRVWAD